MSNIKVSIVVPVYRTEKYLKKCIDSIVNQSLKEIEIILINDGSDDNVESIILGYKDQRIKYIKKNNTGIGSTRNLGITKSKGEYILFVDSDDYIHKDYAKKSYEKAKDENADIVITNFYKDYDGKIIKEILDIKDNIDLKKDSKYLFKINLGPCNKLYKRKLIENIKFNENTKYEDAPFVVEALLKANKVSFLNEYLSYYVIHADSQTTMRDNKIFDILKVSKQIIEICNKYKVNINDTTDLIVLILTNYIIQLRYVEDIKLRNAFINEAHNILNDLNTKWKKAECLKEMLIIKRLIKTNKCFTRLYLLLYNFAFKNKINKS